MLSEKLHEALNAQVNAEFWSAYLYLSMSMDAEAKGLKGVANWFYVQFQEEQDHARILMNYILSRDGKVSLKPIEAVRTEWASPLEMFQDTLVHEKKVTAMINNLASIAAEDKDYASSNMLVWFVDEQVEEEESAREMMKNFCQGRVIRFPRGGAGSFLSGGKGCRAVSRNYSGSRSMRRRTMWRHSTPFSKIGAG